MIGAVPVQNALLMTGYGAGKRWSDDFGGGDNASKLMAVFVGGCVGGVLQSFVMSPVSGLELLDGSSCRSVGGTSTSGTEKDVNLTRSTRSNS